MKERKMKTIKPKMAKDVVFAINELTRNIDNLAVVPKKRFVNHFLEGTCLRFHKRGENFLLFVEGEGYLTKFPVDKFNDKLYVVAKLLKLRNGLIKKLYNRKGVKNDK